MNEEFSKFILAVEAKLDRMLALIEPLVAKVANIDERSKTDYKEWLTAEDIAARTGRKPFTVRRWNTKGIITGIRIEGSGPRGRLLFHRSELDKLMKAGLGGHPSPNMVPSDQP